MVDRKKCKRLYSFEPPLIGPRAHFDVIRHSEHGMERRTKHDIETTGTESTHEFLSWNLDALRLGSCPPLSG